MKLELVTNEEINMLHSKFKKFNTHLVEEPSKLYNHIGIMDVYNRVLTEEEASELLGRSHNLKYGPKFVSTFTNLFHIEENEVYVHIYKKGLVKAEFRQILSRLNRKEANFFRKLFSSNKGIYKIGDVEALIFLTKLSVNELYFTNFFFPSLDTVIIGNWDLSLPVYSKTTIGFQKFKEIIEENGLFIRQ
ncbi:hypothetical protein [Peribacillus frigoritolerans]|uniref:DUF3786 domain-containing protein n=1 Tax=Peribacillus frigoritolerans TaxID=450367 RepID=A0AAJ1QM10_9BACI|nr:hypothetical protein [Peribacillus frigoritolerans]MDM5283886.1 hypothetical protein [Peribacillus frigoritolerans]